MGTNTRSTDESGATGMLDRLHFEITINAKAKKVYDTMLDEKKFKEWTSVFNPASYFKGSWEKDTKMLFMGTDNDGNQGGMVSRIKENIPARFVSIEHYGIIKDGKEITSGPEVRDWAGGLENYTFLESKGKTLLSIDVDSNDEFKSFFEETWPKALETLKSICEVNN